MQVHGNENRRCDDNDIAIRSSPCTDVTIAETSQPVDDEQVGVESKGDHEDLCGNQDMVIGEGPLLLRRQILPGLFVDPGKEVVVQAARGDEEHNECLCESAWIFSSALITHNCHEQEPMVGVAGDQLVDQLLDGVSILWQSAHVTTELDVVGKKSHFPSCCDCCPAGFL